MEGVCREVFGGRFATDPNFVLGRCVCVCVSVCLSVCLSVCVCARASAELRLQNAAGLTCAS